MNFDVWKMNDYSKGWLNRCKTEPDSFWFGDPTAKTHGGIEFANVERICKCRKDVGSLR